MTSSEVTQEAIEIRDLLKSKKDCADNPIDDSLNPVPPFNGGGEIKLIIIGQDPTVDPESDINAITTTLKLNVHGPLKIYIDNVCAALGITLENVYATNVFKYFYTTRPAETMHVLYAHVIENLVLLKKELAMFPEARIITLGEPVLKLLTGKKEKVNYYWDYIKPPKNSSKDIEKCGGKFKKCDSINEINRIFYPFPHLTTVNMNRYYIKNKNAYLDYVKNDLYYNQK